MGSPKNQLQLQKWVSTSGIAVGPRRYLLMLSVCISVLALYGSHIPTVISTLRHLGLDSETIAGIDKESVKGPFELSLKRSIMQSSGGRTKSACEINGQTVTLKVLKAVASPLLATVNAPSAGVALSRPTSRMAMIDTGKTSTICTDDLLCPSEKLGFR